MKKYLFVIPARAGSKGIPGKNVKILGEKPLIKYSIDYARLFTTDDNICLSTNDVNVIKIAKDNGMKIPFIRPEELSSDNASADAVIKHAISYYAQLGVEYDAVIYLQPTSPFRKNKHLKDAISLFENGIYDVVVSVCESSLNPYFSLFEENSEGYLKRSKKMDAAVVRRQDIPKVYLYNGSIFIINIKELMKSALHDLPRIKKYEMEGIYSLDIDSTLDWDFAEFLVNKKGIDFD